MAISNIVEVIVKAVDNASATLKQISGTVEGQAASMQKLGLAMGAVGVAIEAGLVAAALTTARYGEELHRASLTTGIMVEDLARLKFAGEQTGTSFDEMQIGLKFLARSMAAAQDQGSAQALVFRQLGVATTDVHGALRNTNDVVLDLADALSRVTNPTDRAAAAIVLFGRSGINMLPMLLQGSEGIKAWGDEAARLGVVMSKDATDAAHVFENSMHALHASVQGVTLSVGNAFIPILTALVKTVTEIVVQFSAWVRANPEMARQVITIAAGAGVLAIALGSIAAILPSVIAGFGLMGVAITALAGMAGGIILPLVAAVVTLVAALGGFAHDAKIDEQIKQLERWGMIGKQQAEEMTVALLNGSEAQKEAVRKQVVALETLAQAKGLVRDTTLVSPNLDAEAERIKKVIDAILLDIKNTQGKMLQLEMDDIAAYNVWQREQWQKAADFRQQKFNEDAAKAEAALLLEMNDIAAFNVWQRQQWEKAAQERTARFMQQRIEFVPIFLKIAADAEAMANDMTKSLGAGLESMLNGTRNFGEAMGDIWKSIKGIIVHEIVDAAMQSMGIFTTLKGWIDNLFGGGGGGGLGILGLALAFLQEGGIVTKPTLAMVGEEPEAVIPLSKMADMGMGGMGGSITVNFTHNGPLMGNALEAQSFAREIMLHISREADRR